MKLDLSLWNGDTPVPYAPAKTVSAKKLGGGATILKKVGGSRSKPPKNVVITKVRVSVPQTPTQSPWHDDYLVKMGEISVPVGSTIVIVWQGLKQPVILVVRDKSAVNEIRAALKLVNETASGTGAPTP